MDETPRSRRKNNNLRLAVNDGELQANVKYFDSLSSGPASETRPRSQTGVKREVSRDSEISWNCVVASTSGRRPYNEDRYSVSFLRAADQSGAVVGVYDGHGGSNASQYVSERMASATRDMRSIMDGAEWGDILPKVFQQVDDEYLKVL